MLLPARKAREHVDIARNVAEPSSREWLLRKWKGKVEERKLIAPTARS